MLAAPSLRFRISLFFVSFFAIVLLSFSALLYHRFASAQEESFDASLFNYASDVSKSFNLSVFGEFHVDRETLMAQQKIFPFTYGQTRIQIIDHRGRFLASPQPQSPPLPVSPSDLSVFQQSASLLRTITLNKTKYRMITFPIQGHVGFLRVLLQVAVPIGALEAQKTQLLQFLYVSVPLVLLLIFLAGYWFSKASLAPLHSIISKANEIGASDLSQRLPTSQGRDELHLLSATLNHLLDRLQQAFVSQDEFIANASHQLRTPLAVLKGEMDVFKSRPRSDNEVLDFIDRTSQELNHLTQIVERLLLLAKVDSGHNDLELAPVQLEDVLFETTRRLKSLAQKYNVIMRFNMEPPVQTTDYQCLGEAELLGSMLQSIIENAIRHSPKPGTVTLELSREPEYLVIKVHNDGPPISPEERSKLFQRFYRSSPDSPLSTEEQSGVGLGLSIAQKITQIHNGQIEVESDENKGTTFSIRIKKN